MMAQMPTFPGANNNEESKATCRSIDGNKARCGQVQSESFYNYNYVDSSLLHFRILFYAESQLQM